MSKAGSPGPSEYVPRSTPAVAGSIGTATVAPGVVTDENVTDVVPETPETLVPALVCLPNQCVCKLFPFVF
jgi:hypothetical protein